MKKYYRFSHSSKIFMTLLIIFSHQIPATIAQPKNDVESKIKLPEGFYATIFADNIGYARHITVATNGDVYVALRTPTENHSIVALRDNNDDGIADTVERFGETGGTGIKIYKNYLYFSPDTAIIRYRLKKRELMPTEPPEIVIKDLPNQRQHNAKPFDFDNDGNLYVNIGAPSNACQEELRTPGSKGQDPCPQLEMHGGIWRFDAERLNQTQDKDGYCFATGLRNCVAISWNPIVNQLYVVQHGRDQLNTLWKKLYDNQQNAELPAEEFFLVNENSNFGWPYCYYDGYQKKKVLAPEYGGDGKIVGRCNEFEKPIMIFPAHWAPNSLLFYSGKQFPEKYRGGAFIAFHGSWNRAPLKQQGYNVVFVPFNDKLPAGEWEIFADNFAEKENFTSPREAKHRPMGLAQGPNGELFISDSARGTIWKVIYKK